VRDFLAMGSRPRPAGAARINSLYIEFEADLPVIAERANLHLADLEPLSSFNDWHHLAARWLRERARSSR
jgi:hypothetical protein